MHTEWIVWDSKAPNYPCIFTHEWAYRTFMANHRDWLSLEYMAKNESK